MRARDDENLVKEQMAKHIIEEIFNKVCEGSAEVICEDLPEQFELDQPESGRKEVVDTILHSQDGSSANVSMFILSYASF